MPDFALTDEPFEFGSVLDEVAAKTLLLQREIVELALVGGEGFDVDERGTEGLVFVLVELGKFEASDGIDALFERKDAVETPLRVGDILREFLLAIGDGM